MKYDPQIHHRRSMRLNGYDYTLPGAYFVTMVTWRREQLFGTVVNGEMQLSALGKIVQAEWLRSAEIRKEIRLFEDEFVVMPNHVHGIVWIVDINGVGTDAIGVGGVGMDVGADGVRPRNGGVHPMSGMNMGAGVIGENQEGAGREEGAYHAPQPEGTFRRTSKSLGSFIAGFKASVTSRAKRELNIDSIWQRNYHDHIIRSEAEFTDIWKYIDSNPLHWNEDQLHPSAAPNRFNQDNS